MSHVLSQSELTRFQESEPGDLVCFEDFHEKAIGIVLKKNEDSVLVGALQNHQGSPNLIWNRNDMQCVKYGADWSIEPVDSVQVFPAPVEPNRRAGLIVLSTNGWFMNFVSGNIDAFGRFNSEWWSLNTYQALQGKLGRAAVYDRWKLWASIDDYERPHALPILEYEAKPTEPY